MNRRIVSMLVALTAGGLLADAADAAGVTITPTSLPAGKTVTITLTLPLCSSSEAELFGNVISQGGAAFASVGNHQFSGKITIVPKAKPGSHSFSVRCAGGNAGSVNVKITGPRHSGHGQAQTHASPTGTQILRIGWVYTDELYTGTHAGRLKIKWNGCSNAKGYYVDFPDSARVFPFRDPPGPKTHERLLLVNGLFVGQPYVGASDPAGTRSVTLSCLNGKKHLLFTGHLKVKFIHDLLHFSSSDEPTTIQLPLLGAGVTDTNTDDVLVPACSDPKVASVTLTSPALALNAQGLRSVTLPHGTDSPPGVGDPGFTGPITGATDTPPGTYPVTVACGSGVIGTGSLTLRAAS
jgi:hypothetical protein